MARETRYENDEMDHDTIVEAMHMNPSDLITLTARLAQLLAEEADLLEAQKIGKIADLQKEKLALLSAIETFKKQVLKYPSLMEEITDEEREDMRSVIMIFNEILEENYKRLSMARAVNAQVVQAITEAVQEATKTDQYDRKGESGKAGMESISVTVNEKV